MLIKPISFWQQPYVAGVPPTPPTLSDLIIAGQDFYTFNGNTLGSTTTGGIARVSPLGVLDTTWTANANPSPTTNVYWANKAGNGKIYADCRTTTSTTQRVREIDYATGVVNREISYTGTIGVIEATPSISDFFLAGGSVNLNISTPIGRSIHKINTSTMTYDSTFYTNIGTASTSNVTGAHITPTKIGLATGTSTGWNGSSTYSRFVILNHDGTRDTSFVRTATIGAGSALAITYFNNKWIVGGAFTLVNGATQQRIVAFNDDGSLNTTFNTNTATLFGASVTGFQKINDDKLIVFGVFNSNGQVATRICILNGDGTVQTNIFGTGFTAQLSNIVVDEANDLMYVVGRARLQNYNGTLIRNIISIKISDGTINTNFVCYGDTGFGMETAATSVAIGNAGFF